MALPSMGRLFESCLENLYKVLQRCIAKGLVLNREKCHLMVSKGIVLESIIYDKVIEVDQAKVELILKLPNRPSTKKNRGNS